MKQYNKQKIANNVQISPRTTNIFSRTIGWRPLHQSIGRIITIGKTALFEPWPSLEDSARSHPVFTYLDFITIIVLQSKARQPCVQPPNLEDQVSVFMSPSDRVVQLYPQAPGSLFVAFYGSRGYGGGILTRLLTGNVGRISEQNLYIN
jgi:hypothetical protein